MESTYGDRLHEPVADLKGQLAMVLEKRCGAAARS